MKKHIILKNKSRNDKSYIVAIPQDSEDDLWCEYFDENGNYMTSYYYQMHKFKAEGWEATIDV